MVYHAAAKLHNGDEVTVKKTGQILRVVSIETPKTLNMVQRKSVLILCDDGNTYLHTEIS